MQETVSLGAIEINDSMEEIHCVQMLVTLTRYPAVEGYMCTWTSIENHCDVWDTHFTQKGTTYGQEA